ncbi:10218_t:CDS:10 [Diversispora eburnea]|uniref:Translation initiation factor eIF2B subunit epsilon n=1 Tax=Diversispora eburnea TaxID=1213867 RepID=A0A9N8Z5Q7_9GLOM|nr:10218_t:CDS:10 [Diversispora eburnea]
MGPPKSSGKNIESENVLQAVVLADSFNERFRPITLDKPRVSRSVGDALRELDAKQLISSDFILISGDVVSNIHLEKNAESERQKYNHDNEASPLHRTRALGESSIFVLDVKTNECVHFESIETYPRKRRMVMDMEIFDKHTDIQIRNDLIDCQIDICSVEVPALFTENFDYQDMRKDFVYGILTSDLLGKTIYCHVVKDAYAARVRSLQTYDAISKDILSRWTYPIVPDSNLQEGDSYEYMRGQIYKEKNVELSRSCSLGEKVLIGAGTKIADHTKITNSVIGRGVNIGPNVEINDAYIWDDVTINANCSISRSILANKVILEENVIVNKGCLIGYDVIGKIGKGYLWIDEISDDDDEAINLKNVQVASLAYNVSNISLSESSASIISDQSSYEESDSDESTAQEIFQKEVVQTLERAFSDGHTVEIALLELNTLRLASNTNFHDLRVVVIPTHYTENQSQLKVFAQICRILYEMDIIEEDALIEWYYSTSTISAESSSTTTTKDDAIHMQSFVLSWIKQTT